MTPSELKDAVKVAGVSQAALARAMRWDPSVVSKILSGKRRIRADEVPRIEEFLGHRRAENYGGRVSRGTARRTDVQPYTFGEDLPILGHGRGGRDGFFFAQGSLVDRVERPAALRNVPDAYAVYMHGTSQEPRIRHGELCFVHPHQPPLPGDDVVVQLVNDEGFIKTYIRGTVRALHCSQYNPPEEIEWPSDQVEAVHRIVWIARTIR